jgi:hypothetical protein
MNIDEAVTWACREASLAKALARIAVWETERVVSQASRSRETGVKTGASCGEWDTCFELCFQRVIDAWPASHAGEA